MSIDDYVELSHYSFFYIHILPTDILRHINILLFLDVNIIDTGLNVCNIA